MFVLPGETLVTAFPGGHYAAVPGTSFSTALMSGSVALLAQIKTNITSNDAANLLHTKALPVAGFSSGRVNLPAVMAETIKKR